MKKCYMGLILTLWILLGDQPAYAMHISDGVLSVKMSMVWFLLAAPFLYLGIRAIERRRKEHALYMPMLAMMGAAVFILSVLHIPVPVAGSCSHPTGGALAAITIGLFPAMVINFVALIFQTLFLAHGGMLSLGANTFSMGIVGVLSGYGVFRLLRKTGCSLFISAGVAGLICDLITYFVAGLELAIDLHGSRSILKVYGLYMLGYLPTQLPLAILDFVLTGFMVRYIAQKRPDLAQRFLLISPQKMEEA